MKIIKLLFIILFVYTTSHQINAQIYTDTIKKDIKTEKIRVSGLCELDKHRIEKAAYSVNGVKSAIWNENTKILTIKYVSFKTNTGDLVQQRVAKKGNDTEKYKASDEVYDKLPKCCRYRDLKE